MLKRVLMILLGACISGAIVAWQTNEFPLEVLMGFVVGGLIFLLVHSIMNTKKKDNTP